MAGHVEVNGKCEEGYLDIKDIRLDWKNIRRCICQGILWATVLEKGNSCENQLATVFLAPKRLHPKRCLFTLLGLDINWQC